MPTQPEHQQLTQALIDGMSFGIWIWLSVAAAPVIWWFSKGRVPRAFDNVRGPPAKTWLKGHREQLFHPTDGIQFTRDITRQYGGVVRLSGVFGGRDIFVSDPLALRCIAIKDASIWLQPAEVLATNSVIFGEGLTATAGEVHKKQRKMMNPAFSAAHMKDLPPIFYAVIEKLRDAIADVVRSGPQEVDVLSWTSRGALELIGQSGLGYSFDKLTTEENNEYTSVVKNLLPLAFQIPVARRMAPWFPLQLRRTLADIVPFETMRKLMRIVKVMDINAKQVIETKRDAIRKGGDMIKEQIAAGKDITSILLRANLQEKESDRLPDSQLLGLMNGLIFAAMDTTSSTLARMLHILALKPEIQDRLREEFATVRKNLAAGTELDHDTLAGMPFLDAFCRETLRLYAPVPLNLRTATQDTTLPLSKPIVGKDGREIHEVYIPAGTTAFGGLLIANTSETIWGPDALEFKPERWLSPLPESAVTMRLPGVYSNMMTFWGGGTACIFRFSQLELKVALSVLLPSFTFSPSDKQICWKQSGLQFPSVEGATSLGMPLTVGLRA